MNESYQSGVRCAYELCQLSDPIEVVPGHRRKRYHDDACRQAQHRLLAARRIYETLCQAWVPFLSETQQLLEDLLGQHGETWVRRAIAAITAERDQAQQPRLSEDEPRALRQQWADLQPFTQRILEGLSTSNGVSQRLLSLVTMAIGEERTHALCNSELEQRNAYLEIRLSEYRGMIDLEDRAIIERQFIAVGQLLDYRALPRYRVGTGLDKWEDYRSWTDERTLAEVIVYAREVLAQESSIKENAGEKSKLRQTEKRLTDAEAQVQTLQTQIEHLEAERAEWIAWKEAEIVLHSQLTAMQRYLRERQDAAAIPIVRNGATIRVVALGNDALAVTEDHGLVRLSDDELEQGRIWVAQKTGVPVIATRVPIGSKHERRGHND
jgi:hypothetical protein